MRSCPRKFAFQYIEHVPPEFIPSSLIFGGSIHHALEMYYRTKLEGTSVTREGLLACYLNAWNRQKEQAEKCQFDSTITKPRKRSTL